MTIQEVIRHNKEIGHHFFDKGTMEFFNSRIESELLYGRYFITSEWIGLEGFPRKYTVHYYTTETGNITTVGKFQAYDTLESAIQAVEFLEGEGE